MWIGRSFRVARKNVFFCFQLGVFTHDDNGNKEKEWWRCGGAYGFDVFMSFFKIWDEWAIVDITGH
jgi:hypothetical protein